VVQSALWVIALASAPFCKMLFRIVAICLAYRLIMKMRDATDQNAIAVFSALVCALGKDPSIAESRAWQSMLSVMRKGDDKN
jgi:hypothetical protein